MTIHHNPLCLRTHKLAQRQIYKKTRCLPLSSFLLEVCRRLGGIGWQSKPTRLDSVEQGIGNDAFFKGESLPLCHPTETRETFNRSWMRAPTGPSRLSPFQSVKLGDERCACRELLPPPNPHTKLNKQIPRQADVD
jgi:hypothetical protein